ncbi:Uncharacterised protein [Bordetella pertussis]|nr:Uncharacterised protein [Bordetella pertussis]CFU81456.1 Uncharacterised protein [Bordetella pertussis]CPL19055.1 Uncharacterised protein [Bordetella pertussis]CPL79320.1 Uncharacterised protein [Bordetella pertussis]CPN45048.1 Uncharacterised protein [Bordetella pertussis]
MPRLPKPPGTRMASRCLSWSVPRVSISSESMYSILTLERVWMPACTNASLSDLYDSVRSTYLPTMPMVTESCGCSSASTRLSHMDRSAGGGVRPRASHTMLSTPCLCSMAGIL